MFRVLNLTKKMFIPSINQAKMRFFSHSSSIDTKALLNLAHDFEKEGKVRTAEDIYKKIIASNPKCKEAYEQLMESWIRTRSLKVSQQDLKDFIKNYENNFGANDKNKGTAPSPK
jgi:lipopolysaccharide biosynthesis regulator YciM